MQTSVREFSVLLLMPGAGKLFINFCIAASCCTFSAIPPAVVLIGTYLTMPVKFDAFIKRLTDPLAASASPSPAAGGSQEQQYPLQKTRKGCTCKFPFDYAGETHTSCMMIEGLSLTGYHPDTLWCDTGPECGSAYTAGDRPYTNRGCCFDVCVDENGRPLRRQSLADKIGL